MRGVSGVVASYLVHHAQTFLAADQDTTTRALNATEASQGVVNYQTGISATDTSHLFSCFYQASGSRSGTRLYKFIAFSIPSRSQVSTVAVSCGISARMSSRSSRANGDSTN